MQPLFFPFTNVDHSVMDAANKFFEKMTVYQVLAAAIPERMKAWQDNQQMDIRLPLKHHEKAIASLLREYRAWANLHQGGDLSFFKTQGGQIPFFDDSSVAHIRKEIKAGGEERSTTGVKNTPDLYPGVFLQMAQDLDEQNREIAGDMESQAVQERELMKNLKGDALDEMPSGLGAGMPSGDQEAHMIPERMTAWARIALADDLALPMLITSQPAVIDDLAERVLEGSTEMLFLRTLTSPAGNPGDVSRCREALAAFLGDMCTRAWDGEKEGRYFDWDCKSTAAGARLSLYVIPGMTPRALLEGYAASDGLDAPAGKVDGSDACNTVVGVLVS